MNRKVFLFIAMLLCFTVSISYAQNEVTDEPVTKNVSNTEVKSVDEVKNVKLNAFQLNPNSLGFYGCYPITGGFSYQRWIDKFGIQLTVGGFATGHNYADYNVQLQLQGMVFGKDIASWFATAFYPFAIIGHRGEGTASSFSNEPMQFDFSYYLGGGIAFELLFVKHLSLSLELSLVGVYPWELTMGGGGSIKFRF